MMEELSEEHHVPTTMTDCSLPPIMAATTSSPRDICRRGPSGRSRLLFRLPAWAMKKNRSGDNVFTTNLDEEYQDLQVLYYTTIIYWQSVCPPATRKEVMKTPAKPGLFDPDLPGPGPLVTTCWLRGSSVHPG